MITVKLETRLEGASGEIGTCLADLPYMEDDVFIAAPDGILIAHDCVEHIQLTSDIGSIDDEHQALGVAWYGRGSLNDVTRGRNAGYHTPHSDLASDLAREYLSEAGQEDYWQRSHPADSVKLSSCKFAQDLKEIAKLARADIKSEQRHDGASHSKAHCKRYLRRAIRSMVLGIRKAEKRYGSQRACNTLFWNIAGAVAPYCADREYAGQEFELQYCIADGSATCEESYGDDDDWN